MLAKTILFIILLCTHNYTKNKLYYKNKANITVFLNAGDFKPQITSDGNCHDVTVTTCGYNSYPIDPLDFGGLISADVTKSKFKLEDVILDNVCSETPVVRNQCRDVNVKAFELALSIASEEARTRYLTQGRQLLFGDDSVSPWVKNFCIK